MGQTPEMGRRLRDLLAPLPDIDIFPAMERDALGCATFAALNQSLLQDCAYIRCPGPAVGAPGDATCVEVTFVSSGSSSTCPRVVVEVEENARLQVVETHLSL